VCGGGAVSEFHYGVIETNLSRFSSNGSEIYNYTIRTEWRIIAPYQKLKCITTCSRELDSFDAEYIAENGMELGKEYEFLDEGRNNQKLAEHHRKFVDLLLG
jgi:hypothetical protein